MENRRLSTSAKASESSYFLHEKVSPSRVFRVDSPALHVIPLLRRLAHGECLSGQNAARGNRREERALIHRAEQRRRRAVLGKPRRVRVAVHVIQRPAALFAAGLIEVFLQHVHQQAVAAPLNRKAAPRAALHERHLAAVRQRHAVRAQIPLKPALQRVDLRAEDHAVNGSEDQRGAVQVDQLAEREPRGMIDPRLVGKRRLDLLPAGFRRRQRVVAVADREEEAAALPLHPRDLLRRPRGQLALDRVPGDVPAAEHQFRVVELGQFPIRQRLDEAHFRIVDEHHRVRALDARPLPDAHARRDARENRPLRRADGRGCTGREIILLQIQLTNQPKAFAEANASGHLTNAANYLAIVGPANDEEAKERAGFYAERMVLTATLRGLGTLWVAGSWDKAEAAKHCRVTSGQELYLGVVIGHPKNHLDYQAKSYEELCEAQRTHRATKTYEQFTATMSDEGREAAPDWFKSGVEAAMKAPSAMNRQPITFSYNPADDTAAAHIDQSAEDEHHAFNDMGIAKLHFQIGAGQGQWAWGDGGLFIHK